MTEQARGPCDNFVAEIERLTTENWQLKQACGYPIPADKETPQNPFKCGTCDAKATDLESLTHQRDQLLAALKECGAAWASSPGTVMGAAAELGCEFKRRMQIACDAVAAVEEKP